MLFSETSPSLFYKHHPSLHEQCANLENRVQPCKRLCIYLFHQRDNWILVDLIAGSFGWYETILTCVRWPRVICSQLYTTFVANMLTLSICLHNQSLPTNCILPTNAIFWDFTFSFLQAPTITSWIHPSLHEQCANLENRVQPCKRLCI